jgi:AcrR family transcriptional regulator
MTEERAYHHGDLRRSILDAAMRVIAADGPGAISLRDLARQANVSHAAPAHHFGTKAGLLTAIAVEGYTLLGEALTRGPEPSFLDVGARYVRFALDHPAHFEVMFRPDLYDQESPAVIEARARTNAALQRAAGSGTGPGGSGSGGSGSGGSGSSGTGPGSGGSGGGRARPVAAWSLAHGFATLWANGSLARTTGAKDPIALFRSVAREAFASG